MKPRIMRKKNNDNDTDGVAPLSSNGSSKKKGNHKFSKSVGSIFGNKNKKKNDENNKKYASHKAAQSEAMENVSKAVNKAQLRGEKLNELADKSDAMADSAKNFNDLAKQLANKKW